MPEHMIIRAQLLARHLARGPVTVLHMHAAGPLSAGYQACNFSSQASCGRPQAGRVRPGHAMCGCNFLCEQSAKGGALLWYQYIGQLRGYGPEFCAESRGGRY